MTFRDTLDLALRNLRQARLRTSLTMLGVSIGIASLSGMVSLGVGLQEQFVGRFLRSGMFDTINVVSGREALGVMARAAARGGAAGAKKGAELDDAALGRIAALDRVREVYPNLRAPVEVRLGETTEFGGATGVPLSARNIGVFQKIAFGSFFENASDDACMLTLDFARRMTDGKPESLIGRELTLGYPSLLPSSAPGGLSVGRAETKVRVVGIIEREGGPMMGAMLASVMLPLEKAREVARYDVSNPRAVFDQFASRRSYMTATVRVSRPQDAEDVQKKIRDMGFSAFSLNDALQGARRAFIILDILLGLVGSIALVVASLGIVNTMVMSILERTREIGVMKAIGADDGDVRRIFLLEASTIGLAGGVVGVILGWVVGRAINFGANVYIEQQGGTTGQLFSLPWWLVAGALAFSAAVSLLAGSYPASRAARLDPIRALRHD